MSSSFVEAKPVETELAMKSRQIAICEEECNKLRKEYSALKNLCTDGHPCKWNLISKNNVVEGYQCEKCGQKKFEVIGGRRKSRRKSRKRKSHRRRKSKKRKTKRRRRK